MAFSNYPYRSEAEASEFLDKMRWPDGVICPRCDSQEIWDMSKVRGVRSAKNPKGKVRYGLKKCKSCRFEFRSTYNTPFHGFKLQMDILLASIVLLNNQFERMTASYLSRRLGIGRATVKRLQIAADDNIWLRSRRSVPQNNLTLEVYTN